MRPIVWYRHHGGTGLLPKKSVQLHFGAWTGITMQVGHRELRIGLYIPNRRASRKHG